VELIGGALIVLGLAGLAFVVVLWLHRPTRDMASQALRAIPDVVRMTRSLLVDPTTPASAKLALGGLLAYLISPIDLVPDFIPGLGQLDDVVLAALVLRWTGRRIGVDGLRAHWSGSAEGFSVLLRMLGL
jgi:uncharacterized membrane protein YkvA (DUF1232 family)